ncbi:MAG: Fe-S protein assembly chaperone HscA [Armatimonadota bacterium]
MAEHIGIDLGTTHSLVAATINGVPTVLPDPETGETLLPSIVHFALDGTVVVGTAAEQKLVTDPLTTIYSAKRLMGRGAGDSEIASAGLAYAITADCQILLPNATRVSAPAVASHILKTLATRAAATLGTTDIKAVITVPAYFNDAQRQATRDAAALAGLSVERIINEPTAASLAVGLHRLNTATIAVYDLGGGTFDVSILRLDDGVFEVLATGGNTRLGGDDFDQAIASWLQGFGLQLPTSDLRVAAESAKVALSSSLSTDVLGVVLTRPVFEGLIGETVEKTITITAAALADAGLTIAGIDAVVLVGGSTRVPLVRSRVEAYFGKSALTDVDPDQVVALGAAIQADILAGNRTDTLLLDVTPLSLGIETIGGATEKLIYRNTRIPTQAVEHFTTSKDGQTKVLIHVVQGEREMAADNRSLARIELTGIPALPAGIPKVNVTFRIDANGILRVDADEERSGTKAVVRVKPTYGIEQSDVRAAVRASFVHADEDVAARTRADMVNEATSALVGLSKLFVTHRDRLEAETVDAITAARLVLEDAIQNAPDHTTIREAWDALEDAARPLAELAMSDIATNLVSGKTLTDALAFLEERSREHKGLDASGA